LIIVVAVVVAAVLAWLIAAQAWRAPRSEQAAQAVLGVANDANGHASGGKSDSEGLAPSESPAVTRSAGPDAASVSISDLYNATSVADLIAKAGAFDPHDPDAFELVLGAEQFCSFARRFLSPASANKSHVSATAQAQRSLQLMAEFVDSYCNGPLPPPGGRGLANEIADELMAKTKDADYRRVLEIEASHSASMSDAERAGAMAELTDILARTTSPEVLSSAGNALAGGRFGAWQLGRESLAWTPFEGRASELQTAAVVLAQCRLARSCGPNALITMRMCAPALCTPGMSAEDYFRRIFSADEFGVVAQMRDEIERARGGGG
jgi:hypothetical protein